MLICVTEYGKVEIMFYCQHLFFTMFDITLTNFDVLHIIIFFVCSVWGQTAFKEEGIEMVMAKDYKNKLQISF